MARNIGADGRTVYRAVVEKTYADGRTYTAHEGPYTEPGPARARVSFWRNRMAAYEDGSSATGHVEQAHTVWTPVGEQADPLAVTPEFIADHTRKVRSQAYRDAADALDASKTLRDLTDDHMHDVHAAANELRRLADAMHPAAEETDQ